MTADLVRLYRREAVSFRRYKQENIETCAVESLMLELLQKMCKKIKACLNVILESKRHLYIGANPLPRAHN